MEGLGWRIENGLTVGVLDDKWIPMEDRVICPESNGFRLSLMYVMIRGFGEEGYFFCQIMLLVRYKGCIYFNYG